MRKPTPTPEELRRLLRYEPETGRLFWLTRPREMFPDERAAKSWNTQNAHKEAFTSSNSRGYRQGSIHDRKYPAHRVVWALHHGEWPPEQIDHINGSRVDNRIENLRAVTATVNQRNKKMQSNNASGYNGVSWCKTYEKWLAYTMANGKRKNLGRFDNINDAVAARRLAEAGLGFTARHGLDDTHIEKG